MSYAAAIQTLLNPLASGGAWNQRAGQNVALPYIVYSRVVTVINNSLSGASNLQPTRLQVDVYAQTANAADALAQTVTNTLIASSLKCVRISVQDFYEDDTQLYRVSQDFSYWA